MYLTDYHAKYFAHELTKRCPSDSLEKLAGALVDAQVDLNPHQIDAALFAFKSPLSKGAIFADEVGLGKTIRVFETLKARLQPVCQRTLRRQVQPYVRYTKRLPIVQPFIPEEGEDRLYHSVSEYLRRDNLQALPASQRLLMTLVLRKLLASSTFAIAGALESLSRRLRARLQQAKELENLEEELNEDFEALDEMAEEWGEEDTAPGPLSTSERTALSREIADLESFRALAVSITHNDIYQCCRTLEEINASFDQLQQELSQQIDEAMTRARQQLLENFDEEAIEKLRISRDSSNAYLDHYERMRMDLTHHELRDHIKVLDGGSSFQLTSCPFVDDIPLGLYELPRRSGEANLYRLAHPLARHVLAQAKSRVLPPAEITFDYTNHLPIISVLKPLVGQEGSLRLSLLTIGCASEFCEDILRPCPLPPGEG